MADDETPETPQSEPEKPARRRTRAPKPEGEAAAEKPARTRAPKADAAAAEDAAEEKPARTRSRAAKADAPAAQDAAEEKPAPRRTRARKPAEDAAGEAPKPRRTRARKPAAEEPVAEERAAEESAAAPAPARRTVEAPPSRRALLRRSRRPDPTGAPPVVYATAKYVRSSPRKARLVCDHIRGKSVSEARAILAFAPRGVARDWSKLLESAVANAEHNHELIGDELRIKAVYADAGPTIKRFTPRAQGRATPILKRTSHLSIALTPKE
jgi:ribosomal protein L22